MKRVPLSCCLVTLLSAPLIGVQAVASGQPPEPSVSAVDTYVPFSAETRIETESGQVIVGRYFRRSDGSTRSETGPAIDAPTVILINNYTTKTSHFWTIQQAGWGWTSYPLEFQVHGPFHPDEQWLAMVKPVRETVDGLALLLVRKAGGAEGSYSLVAPGLNYYNVVTGLFSRDAPSRCSTNKKVNIRIGEPPPELFEPPPERP